MALSNNTTQLHTDSARPRMCLHLKKRIKQNFNVRRSSLLCFYPASYIQHEQLMGMKTACGLWFRVAGRLWARILELRLGTQTQACTFLTHTHAVALTRCRRSGRIWLYMLPTHHLSWITNGVVWIFNHNSGLKHHWAIIKGSPSGLPSFTMNLVVFFFTSEQLYQM